MSRLLGCFTIKDKEEYVKITDFGTNRMLYFDPPLQLSRGRWMLEIEDETNSLVVSIITKSRSVALHEKPKRNDAGGN